MVMMIAEILIKNKNGKTTSTNTHHKQTKQNNRNPQSCTVCRKLEQEKEKSHTTPTVIIFGINVGSSYKETLRFPFLSAPHCQVEGRPSWEEMVDFERDMWMEIEKRGIGKRERVDGEREGGGIDGKREGGWREDGSGERKGKMEWWRERGGGKRKKLKNRRRN